LDGVVSIAADNSCLQYYTGVSGTIRSFNYDDFDGRQLSNQDYTVCIRTESNFCGIAYTTCPGGTFSITGPTGGSQLVPGTPVGVQVRRLYRVLPNPVTTLFSRT